MIYETGVYDDVFYHKIGAHKLEKLAKDHLGLADWSFEEAEEAKNGDLREFTVGDPTYAPKELGDWQTATDILQHLWLLNVIPSGEWLVEVWY